MKTSANKTGSSAASKASSPSVEQCTQRITRAITAEEQRLRDKYTFLRHQDWIGLVILLVSLAGMLCSAYAYYLSIIPAWLCIVIAAIFASFSHELEHDLIHRQYFRKNPLILNLMMLVVWMMRPSTINPWYRRKMHFLHHKVSGTEQDLEERLVGNGLPQSFLRYLVMFDGLLGLLARQATLSREVKAFSFIGIFNAGFPFTVIYYGIWYSFLAFHAVDLLMSGMIYPEWLPETMQWLDFMVVVLVAPNFIRSACLNFVTSHMHYYGGVDNVLQQTQILKPWFFAPLHLFCFNFGSTHAIHHFVVGQSFYIRQMVARVAHKVMQENGVRVNDLSTLTHANRWLPASP